MLERGVNKNCTRCDACFPATIEHYSASKNSRDGLRGACRACERERKRAYNRAYQKSEKGREKQRGYEKAWREKNRDYPRKWSEKNPGYFAVWQRANHEKLAVYRKVRAIRLPATESQRQMARAKTALRRARKRSAVGHHTRCDIQKMLTAQHRRCWWCAKSLTKYHVDHRIPLSRGGGNGPDNLVASCPTCNLNKASKMPWEMRENPRLL